MLYFEVIPSLKKLDHLGSGHFLKRLIFLLILKIANNSIYNAFVVNYIQVGATSLHIWNTIGSYQFLECLLFLEMQK